MSAPTGIEVSPELAATFSDAVSGATTTRFLKISIQHGLSFTSTLRPEVTHLLALVLESLVADGVYPPTGTFEQDLDKLPDILEDNVPAYVLVRTDEAQSDWLAIYYVPDTAKVKDKVCSHRPRLF